jgi:hypothetical protein
MAGWLAGAIDAGFDGLTDAILPEAEIAATRRLDWRRALENMVCTSRSYSDSSAINWDWCRRKGVENGDGEVRLREENVAPRGRSYRQAAYIRAVLPGNDLELATTGLRRTSSEHMSILSMFRVNLHCFSLLRLSQLHAVVASMWRQVANSVPIVLLNL